MADRDETDSLDANDCVDCYNKNYYEEILVGLGYTAYAENKANAKESPQGRADRGGGGQPGPGASPRHAASASSWSGPAGPAHLRMGMRRTSVEPASADSGMERGAIRTAGEARGRNLQERLPREDRDIGEERKVELEAARVPRPELEFGETDVVRRLLRLHPDAPDPRVLGAPFATSRRAVADTRARPCVPCSGTTT